MVIVGGSTSAPGSSGCGSILVKNSAGLQRNPANRVEFAATDQVISLAADDISSASTSYPTRQQNEVRPSSDSSSTVAMASPVRTLFGRGHRKVERQTTFESTSSATAEDLLRQVCMAGPRKRPSAILEPNRTEFIPGTEKKQ